MGNNMTRRQARIQQEMWGTRVQGRTTPPVVLREPTREEQVAAKRTASQIVAAVAGAVRITRSSSRRGPGRLLMNEVVRGVVADQSGVPLARPLEPFERWDRGFDRQTPVKVGFIGDLSASMGQSALIMESLIYMVTETVKLAGGEVAVAGFLDGAWPLQLPGERPSVVCEYPTMTGHHAFADCFWLVESALDLLGSDGARVLLTFSDLQLYGKPGSGTAVNPECGSPEVVFANGAFAELEREGVGSVVVMEQSDMEWARSHVPSAFRGGSARVVPFDTPDYSSVDREVAIEVAVGLLPLVVKAVVDAAEATV